jgi:hypothetical protein
MSRRKQAVFKWLHDIERRQDLKTRFASITHFYRGGMFGIQPGPLQDLFDIKGRSLTNTVEWRGQRYLVEVGTYRDPKIDDPMRNIFVYAFVTGADQEIDPSDLVRFIGYHERKVGYKPVNKVVKK